MRQNDHKVQKGQDLKIDRNKYSKNMYFRCKKSLNKKKI